MAKPGNNRDMAIQTTQASHPGEELATRSFWGGPMSRPHWRPEEDGKGGDIKQGTQAGTRALRTCICSGRFRFPRVGKVGAAGGSTVKQGREGKRGGEGGATMLFLLPALPPPQKPEGRKGADVRTRDFEAAL